MSIPMWLLRYGSAALFACALAPGSVGAESVDECLQEKLRTATDATTVGELRAACTAAALAQPETAPIATVPATELRKETEEAARGLPFLLTAHRPTYLLPYTYYDKPNQALYEGAGAGDVLENEEAKFQISFKFPVWQQPFDYDADLYFAFTSVAWWQVYNDGISAPFRETNYEPEFFLRHEGGPEIFGIPVVGWDVGLAHQSNGRADPLSRSWNRVTGQTGLQLTDDLVLGLRAWYRIPESASEDDNPHIHRYMGYGELRAVWTPDHSTFTLMVRPGTEKTGIEATWSYPISRILRAYLQYYNGYGESLIDHDHRLERIGIGIAINDYLQR